MLSHYLLIDRVDTLLDMAQQPFHLITQSEHIYQLPITLRKQSLQQFWLQISRQLPNQLFFYLLISVQLLDIQKLEIGVQLYLQRVLDLQLLHVEVDQQPLGFVLVWVFAHPPDDGDDVIDDVGVDDEAEEHDGDLVDLLPRIFGLDIAVADRADRADSIVDDVEVLEAVAEIDDGRVRSRIV